MTLSTSRTNGFLFSDLRDYTRYVELHGDQAAAVLLDSYRALVRSAVGEFGGAEIKTEGDSFYVVFPSASSAVQCGLAILAAASDPQRAGGTIIRVGIGVHAGETAETTEGYVGSAINLAARVCSLAGPGELLVTDTVRGLTRTFLPVRFVDRRSRRVKGITEPVVIYRVEPLTAEPTATAPALGRRTRVAVLVTGLLIGAAAAGYLLVAAQRPAEAPGASASATPTSAPTFPTAAEADLLLEVPLSIRGTCTRTESPDERVGAAVSLRCDLPVAADAETVWWDRFDTAQALGSFLDALGDRHGLSEVPCTLEVRRGQGNWSLGTTNTGRVLCYQDNGAMWIVWSYQAERVMARAVRSGDSAADWAAFYDWWDHIKIFSRP
jgi:class 3 adenylate cyclase